jgi:hypothetical protein
VFDKWVRVTKGGNSFREAIPFREVIPSFSSREVIPSFSSRVTKGGNSFILVEGGNRGEG